MSDFNQFPPEQVTAPHGISNPSPEFNQLWEKLDAAHRLLLAAAELSRECRLAEQRERELLGHLSDEPSLDIEDQQPPPASPLLN